MLSQQDQHQAGSTDHRTRLFWCAAHCPGPPPFYSAACRLPSGGWRFSLNPASSDDKDQVLIYGVCFVLYALSTYYDATQSDHARVLANELFDNMAARLAPDGGIAPEAFEVDFITPLGGPGSADAVKNGLGHYNDRRSVNTHIHLLETLTAYHALVPAGVKGTARQARSAQAVKAAADLIVAMKDGPRLVELRDLGDATKPASNLRKPQAGSNSQTDGEKVKSVQRHVPVTVDLMSLNVAAEPTACSMLSALLCNRQRPRHCQGQRCSHGAHHSLAAPPLGCH